ncbi:MAG: SMC-Scp complex subunit ScpB [Deltaproteobacteria bacterium]|nr:SMC-Scp complex subunit ScpB [Deltaproteobacteria bacterium]
MTQDTETAEQAPAGAPAAPEQMELAPRRAEDDGTPQALGARAVLVVLRLAAAVAQAEVAARPPPEPPREGPPPGETAAQFLDRLTGIVEAVIFAADHPVTVKELVKVLTDAEEVQATAETVTTMLERLKARHQPPHSGMQLTEVAGGWALRTSPRAGRYLRQANQDKPFRMGRAALETLAMVAYRQPVTKAQVDELRGVDSTGALKALLDKHLVRVLGKAEEVGRPLLYGTTKVFLEAFNLRVLSDLPTLKEYQELSAENQAKVDAQAPVQALGRIRDLAQPGARLVSAEAEQEGDQALTELDRALGAATTTGRTTEVLLKGGGKLPPGMDLSKLVQTERPPFNDEDGAPGDPELEPPPPPPAPSDEETPAEFGDPVTQSDGAGPAFPLEDVPPPGGAGEEPPPPEEPPPDEDAPPDAGDLEDADDEEFDDEDELDDEEDGDPEGPEGNGGAGTDGADEPA